MANSRWAWWRTAGHTRQGAAVWRPVAQAAPVGQHAKDDEDAGRKQADIAQHDAQQREIAEMLGRDGAQIRGEVEQRARQALQQKRKTVGGPGGEWERASS